MLMSKAVCPCSSPPPPVFAAPTQSVASGIRPGHESLGEMRERERCHEGRGQAEKLDTGPTLGVRIAEKLGKWEKT